MAASCRNAARSIIQTPVGRRTAGGASMENMQTLRCPRCDSSNTKFCYYNNYSLSQPRHFCKACKRYWTRGGTLRNVPVGGGCRKNKRAKKPASSASNSPSAASAFPSANSTSRHSHLSFPSVSELFYGNPADVGQLSFPIGSSFDDKEYGIQRQTGVEMTPSLTDLLTENSFTASNPYLSLYTTFQAQMGSGNSTLSTNIKSEEMTTSSGHDHCFNWPLAAHQSTPEATMEMEPCLYWSTLAAPGFGGGTVI
ncbi:unnamed protein product [Spirodela intermedia]|uniref:Dof zinc finger protein n=1 Tax=Spirodela intermedia TaxID=51605 RepID=A0A7I8K9D5_SPIIN|nr:unnamed protein product [Spirodela intermedia]